MWVTTGTLIKKTVSNKSLSPNTPIIHPLTSSCCENCPASVCYRLEGLLLVPFSYPSSIKQELSCQIFETLS